MVGDPGSGHCAELSDRKTFDTCSRTTLRRTDDDVLIGDVTIPVNLMASEHIAMPDQELTVAQLASVCVPHWSAGVQPARRRRSA